MNPITGALVLGLSLLVVAALWAWLSRDFRRYHREHQRTAPAPVEENGFAEALRCVGGPPPQKEEQWLSPAENYVPAKRRAEHSPPAI